MESWYVYVLKSLKDGKLYTGISRNPGKRLGEHNRGKTKSTKYRRPFVLIYTEECVSLKQARDKEKFYKSGGGREKLKSILPGSSIGRAGGC
ncbi:endonuclease [Candidatus Desulfofervidus auxilii]|uniref:Endonuclease n=1 Tax=Desulfofervidus auxilii TaxID=1621989 RepID=A0A7U4TG28_DESA2|nr:endonuclease [Candidatus Desulfofervidus auxilii]